MYNSIEENIEVSVIMLMFNHEKYIHEAVKGVLIQECDFNIELILHDDCSTDNTKTIIEQFKLHKNYHRIRYFCNSQNVGAHQNWQLACEKATGRFIAPCDGDDYWTDPLKLQKQIDYCKDHPEIGLIFTDIDFYIEETGEFQKSVFRNGIYTFKIDFEQHLVNAYYYAPSTWVMKTDLLKTVRKEHYDSDVSYTLMLYYLKRSYVAMLSDSTAVYRLRIESASHSHDKSKIYKWWKGVNHTQLTLASYFGVANCTMELLQVHLYSYTLSQYAFELNDTEFIEKAKNFFKSIKRDYLFSALKVEYYSNQEKKRKSYRVYKYLYNQLRKLKLFSFK
jgi:glucosyltransferase